MKIPQKFLNDHPQDIIISTKDILNWYHKHKSGNSNYTHHTTIYQLIINPLKKKGCLIQIERGFYKVNKILTSGYKEGNYKNTKYITEFGNDAITDEWNDYIQSKLNNVDTNEKGGDLNA
jgi:hypothetical protein